MQAQERRGTDAAEAFVPDGNEPVLDDAAVLERLEAAAPQDPEASSHLEGSIPVDLGPAAGLIRGILAGLFLWVLFLATAFVAARWL
jgi:hypothetical protein